MRSKSESSIPEWKLERYLLGELPAKEQEFIDRYLSKDPQLKERLEALQTHNEVVLSEHPPELFVQKLMRSIEDKALKPQTRTASSRADFGRSTSNSSTETFASQISWLLWLLLGNRRATSILALCACVVLVFVWQSPPTDSESALPTPEYGERIKGDSGLFLDKLGPAGPVELPGQGALLGAGEIVQISYRAVPSSSYRSVYGVIVSIDGGGTITHHLTDGAQAARLELGRVIPLNQAYRLDDAPEFETFFLITHHSPFPVMRVLDALYKWEPNQNRIPHLEEFQQTNLSILKRSKNEY